MITIGATQPQAHSGYHRAKWLLSALDTAALIVLFVCFIIATNYVHYNLGGSGIQLPHNMMTWVAASLFIVTTSIRALVLKRLYWTSSIGLYILFVTVLLLPLSYNDLLFFSVEKFRIVGLLLGLIFLFCVYQYHSEIFKRRLLFILFVSCLIQSIWGLVQYYFVFEDSLLFIRASYDKPFGVFQQVNVFGTYIAMGSMLALYYFYNQSRKNIYTLLAVGALLCINTHLLELAEADTTKYVALLCNVVAIIIYFKKTRYTSSLILIFCILVALILPKSWYDIRPNRSAPSSSESIENTSQGLDEVIIGQPASDLEQNDHPLGTRVTIYRVALDMIADSPWAGHGIGSFPKQYALYQGQYIKLNPDAPYERALNHAHNEILHWTIELGIVSGLAFLLLLVGWLAAMLRRRMSHKLMLIALPAILQSLLEIPFYNSATVFLAFLAVIALADWGKSSAIKLPRWTFLFPTAGSIFLTSKIVLFVFSSMYALSMFLAFHANNREPIQLLTSVSNASAYKLRYEFELFQWKLREAERTKKITKQDLISFIYWAHSTLQYAPMESTYQNYIDALQLLGNKSEAEKVAREGILLYPHNQEIATKLRKLLLNKDEY